MERVEVDKEKEATIKGFWNNFQEDYEANAENVTLQSSMFLYSMTKVRNKQKVCEVGVGCGQAARLYISTLMRPGSSYFASDLSDAMVKTFIDRFNLSDTALNPKVKLSKLEPGESHDYAKLIEDLGDEIERKIFISELNNESLPYPDEFFDCYISNLSLMIVGNHHNQLLEAYRVLQPGGTVGFTVWGRKENTEFFALLPDILEKLDMFKPPEGHRTHFHLSDKDSLVSDIKEAGFKKVKSYYAPSNVLFEDGNSYMDFFYNSTTMGAILHALTPEQLSLLRQTVCEEFESRFGESTLNPVTWEVLVCIAQK